MDGIIFDSKKEADYETEATLSRLQTFVLENRTQKSKTSLLKWKKCMSVQDTTSTKNLMVNGTQPLIALVMPKMEILSLVPIRNNAERTWSDAKAKRGGAERKVLSVKGGDVMSKSIMSNEKECFVCGNPFNLHRHH